MPREAKPRFHKTRKVYYARIGEPNAKGESKMVYFPPAIRTEGQAWDHFRAILEAERSKVVNARDPSFGELAVIYNAWMEKEVAADRMSDGTRKGRRSMLKLVAMHTYAPGKVLGDLPALRLEVDHMAAFLEWMKADYEDHYRKDVVTAVKAMTSWASRPIPGREPRVILKHDPLAGYRPGIAIGKPGRYVAQPDLRRFLRWAWAHSRRDMTGTVTKSGNPIKRSSRDRRFDRIFVLMLHVMRLTGARPKELRTAEWADLDWKAGTITLDPDRHKTGRKTGRERTIYLTPAVARILRALERLHGRHARFIFTHALGPRGYERGNTAETGEPWADTSAIDRKLREYRGLAARAGISIAAVEGPGRLVPYLNRHAFITDAILEGGNVADVAKVVGNSAEVIASVYDHPVRERLAERNLEWAGKRRSSAKGRNSSE